VQAWCHGWYGLDREGHPVYHQAIGNTDPTGLLKYGIHRGIASLAMGTVHATPVGHWLRAQSTPPPALFSSLVYVCRAGNGTNILQLEMCSAEGANIMYEWLSTHRQELITQTTMIFDLQARSGLVISFHILSAPISAPGLKSLVYLITNDRLQHLVFGLLDP